MGKGLSGAPIIAGALVGLLFFGLTSMWLGNSIIPSMDEVEAKLVYAPPEPLPEAPSAADETGEQVYTRVCAACHQASGAGLPPTFPPLAGSDWVGQDAETPIRIVLLGLGGPIDVAGTSYNSVMPAQGALSDGQIAKVLTFVRSSFGNSAAEVSEEQVSKVRASLSGRSNAWTAAELSGMRGESAAAPADESGAAGATAEAPADGETAGTEGTADAEPETAPVDPVVLAEAKKNFDGICASCHGVGGDGAGPAGVVLQPKPANFTDPAFWEGRDRARIIKVITEGGPAVGKSPLMAPFGGQFNEAQIAGLADYVMGFRP